MARTRTTPTTPSGETKGGQIHPAAETSRHMQSESKARLDRQHRERLVGYSKESGASSTSY